jgi:hypothetical protein
MMTERGHIFWKKPARGRSAGQGSWPLWRGRFSTSVKSWRRTPQRAKAKEREEMTQYLLPNMTGTKFILTPNLSYPWFLLLLVAAESLQWLLRSHTLESFLIFS